AGENIRPEAAADPVRRAAANAIIGPFGGMPEMSPDTVRSFSQRRPDPVHIGQVAAGSPMSAAEAGDALGGGAGGAEFGGARPAGAETMKECGQEGVAGAGTVRGGDGGGRRLGEERRVAGVAVKAEQTARAEGGDDQTGAAEVQVGGLQVAGRLAEELPH